jgi:hypothetical protein
VDDLIDDGFHIECVGVLEDWNVGMLGLVE